MEQTKKTILSGIKPTGNLNIGGYLGAVKNWIKMQDEYNCLYCIADLHSLTIRIDPAVVRKNSLELFALYLSCGLDPEKNTIFFQSHVSQHAELSWILNCYTMFGELSRMTQFKDKSAKNAENINAGLFTYPVLMAADILLYQADLVPVGEDQTQHVEICRDIAGRFNGIYGDVFTLPEAYTPKVGARVKSLTNPTAKMSKSDDDANGTVNLLDPRDVVIRKFKKAVTDSEACVRFAPGKDGINNLMTIYSAVAGKSFEEIEKEFEGKGYGDFKLAVGEVVADMLAGIQDQYKVYTSDKAQLEAIYRNGADRARYIANKTLNKVYKKVGFVAK
ncbi:MAG: tryptophan--tRNA ligase [Clostridia bacterium]|nr:tryptophan--tRNA ligase [Clostridia bacterium]MBO5299940.1 tryptophan--tRNA ligase [Clostridia bacterium]MBQ2720183.1 tryptophan--tRNA ligase [Clostridia bacterium]MBQ4627655.1 tryptophan--tRNA ligase [Clostridia bacterium]